MLSILWFRQVFLASTVESRGDERPCGIPRICQSLKSTTVYQFSSICFSSAVGLLTYYAYHPAHWIFVVAMVCFILLGITHAILQILFLDLSDAQGVRILSDRASAGPHLLRR